MTKSKVVYCKHAWCDHWNTPGFCGDGRFPPTCDMYDTKRSECWSRHPSELKLVKMKAPRSYAAWWESMKREDKRKRRKRESR